MSSTVASEENLHGTKSRRRLHIVLALLCLLPLYLVQINWGLPNEDITWAHDANPLGPLITVKRVFLDGWNTGFHDAYPRFHHYVLAVPHGIYMAGQWLAGNLDGLEMDSGYPYGVKDFDTIFMHLAILSRAVSALMALGAIYFTYRTAETLCSHYAGLMAGALIGLSPKIIYYAHTETLDVPMLFWYCAAMYCYVRALQSLETRYYIGLAVLAAISTATKDYAYGAFVLLPIPLIWRLARHKSPENPLRGILPAIFDRRHGWAFVAFVVAFALAENLWWNPSGFMNHVRVATGSDSEDNVSTQLNRFDAFSLERIQQFFFVLPRTMGWVSLPIGVLGVFYVIFRRLPGAAWLAWWFLSYYLFTIVKVVPADSKIDRTFMPLIPILAVFGGALLGGLWSSKSQLRVYLRAAIVLLMGAAAVNAAALVLVLCWDTRYQAEEWLRSNVSDGSTVELYGYRRDLPRRRGDRLAWTVVSHKTKRQWSDVPFDQLFRTENWTAELNTRNPRVVIVSQSYAGDFHGGASKHDTLPNYQQICQFLKSVRKENTSYVRVKEFKPTLSTFFGFGNHIVPSIEAYELKSETKN